MEKCKDDLEREFYLRMTQKFGWTKNVLVHQIENQTYDKTLLNQTNFGIFTFVGSQYRLEVREKEYFIDLLLYHRRLKCLVANLVTDP